MRHSSIKLIKYQRIYWVESFSCSIFVWCCRYSSWSPDIRFFYPIFFTYIQKESDLSVKKNLKFYSYNKSKLTLNNDLIKLIHLINTLINHFLLVKSFRDFNWVEFLLTNKFKAFLGWGREARTHLCCFFIIMFLVKLFINLKFWAIPWLGLLGNGIA